MERAVAALSEGGCDPVVVVVKGGEEGVMVASAARSSGAMPIVNDDPDAEQIDSLRTGMDSLDKGVEAVVVLPVDAPLIEASTVKQLTTAFRRSRPRIVRPRYDKRPGHPVLFARGVWDELRTPGLEEGARTVVRRHLDDIEEILVDDPNVLSDIDTPDEYAREIDRP